MKTKISFSLDKFVVMTALLAGCASHPSNQQIQQQAAQTTQQVKQSAEVATQKARAAAATAEDKIDSVAAGVRQGLQSDASSPINLNTASRDQIASLPGISPVIAGRIIARRPYSSPDDLVTRRLLTPAQLRRLSSQVVTH